MEYVVVESDTIVELTRKVNDYWKIGWEPCGGVSAIRSRVSGPVVYIQAVANFRLNGNPVSTGDKWKRDKK